MSSIPADDSPYGYIPTDWICIVYVTLFGMSTALHFGQSLYSRLWWLVPTIGLGGLAEVIGWTGRLWSSHDPLNNNPFLMQITSTIIAPSFMTAANFIMLGIVISRVGSHYSRLSPRIYSYVFITADVVALVVQGAGGGIASSADTLAGANQGANIMVAGIIWQLAMMTIYVALAAEFFLRVHLDRPVRQTWQAAEEPIKEARFPVGLSTALGTRISLMVLGLALSTLLIYIRSVYRTIELLNGWNGPIITTQVYFNVLDALPVTLAMYTINVLHPSWLLYRRSPSSAPQSVSLTTLTE